MFTQTRWRAAALMLPFAVAALVLTASEAGAVSGTLPVNGLLVSQVVGGQNSRSSLIAVM